MEPKYDQKINEPAQQRRWEKELTYTRENNPGPLYTIDTPPPTVSGNLHIGHIFSYTQTDIIARHKRMQGFSVYYPFGFDDNGLPTERYVEKKLKTSAFKEGRSAFIQLCLKETHEVEEQFKALWQSMGLSADWRACYSTISDTSRKISQESFIDLYKKGFIYRKYEPALYCTTCRTSVAQAELDDTQKPSHFNDIIFKDANGNDLVVGTTRPELLPSCVAMFYNPRDPRYRHLAGTKAIVPIYGFEVPIHEDEQVDIEKGTGLVMCCTFGDKTDIEWFKKFNLPYKQSIGFDGKWLEHTGPLAGLKVHDARTKILEELSAAGLLAQQRAIEHAVNVHERCKNEIEFVALSQWFLKVLEHKQAFLDIADQVNWYPAFMKARYRDWVENLKWDWCLSRQRFFGIPFPVWHCQDCQAILLADENQLPIDPQETAYKGSCSCGSTNIIADTDVMDTWNTSSVTPLLCYAYFNPASKSPLHDKEILDFIPMSMRPQAHDIIRTWAFYSIIKSWMHFNRPPWRDIIISGHVLSDDRSKLSKSKEHKALSPEQLLTQYPADAIRYWTASGGLGQDISFSEAQLKIGQKLIVKLWNAFRFTKEHIQTLENPHEAPKHLGTVNEWLLNETSACFALYEKRFESSEFGLALNDLEQFFWQTFCDNYLELIKNQLFNPDQYPAEQVHATRYTLYHVGLRILQMYAPYVPHVTDAIYELIYKQSVGISSLHQTKFAAVQAACNFERSAQTMKLVNNVIGQMRKLKSEHQLSLKVPLQTLTIVASKETLEQLKAQEQLIKGVAQAVEIIYKEGTAPSELKEVAGSWHATIQEGL